MLTPTPALYPGHVFYDDRGSLVYNNNLSLQGTKRSYIIGGSKGFLRSWHGHRLESKIFQSVQGVARIVVAPMSDESKPQTFFVPANGALLKVPAGYWNGVQHLSDDSLVMVYSDRTTSESEGDDYRMPWDHFGEEIWSLTQYR